MTTVVAGIQSARDVRAFLAAHRRGFRPTLFQGYATLVLGAIVVVFGRGIVASLLAGGVSVPDVLAFGPAVGLVGWWSAMRFGSWHGPVGFSRADIAFLLMAPIPVALLTRPKLNQAFLLAAFIGALAAGVIILLVVNGHGNLGVARILAAILGIIDVSVSSVAVSWLVQSSKAAARGVRRASPVVLLAIVGFGIAGRLTHSSLGVWSGPWGWPVAPLAGVGSWPLAIVAGTACTVLLVYCAHRRAGAMSIEHFVGRARTRSAVGASVFILDYRGATVAYRASQPPRRAASIRFPPPHSPRLVVAWRDVLALTRDPSRVGWAVALTASAIIEASAHPGRFVPAVIAAAALFAGASRLCEPLRLDVDYPDRSWILLSWTYARVLVAHCLIPTLVVGLVATLTVATVVMAGLTGLGTLALIPTLLPFIVLTAVLGAALSARRGGRIDARLLTQVLRTDPTSPASIAIAAMVLAPWVILAVLSNAAIIAVAGHAFIDRRLPLQTSALLLIAAAVSAAVLHAVARNTTPPD